MRPEQIHTLPKGVALMVHPGQQPALVDLVPYTERSYAEQLASDREEITSLLNGRAATDVEDRAARRGR